MTPDSDKLPLCVFLDTEVFRSACFNWTRPSFQILRERVTRGSIEVVTTDIVVREMRSGIRSELNEFSQHLQKALRSSEVIQPLRDKRLSALDELAQAKSLHEQIQALADNYVSSISTTLLAIPAKAMETVFELYFAGEPPFGAKGKKAEFPDAVNMIALIEHARNIDKPIHVVSGDHDWSRVCAKNPSLVHITHLSEMLDRAIRAEWLSDDLWSQDELLGFLRAKSENLKPLLESRLSWSTSVNMGDGVLDSLTVEDLRLEGIAITDIRPRDKKITFGGELFHSVSYVAHVSVDDVEAENVIEDELSGRADLVATVEIDLPLNNPSEIEIVSLDYFEGLYLTVPLDFHFVR